MHRGEHHAVVELFHPGTRAVSQPDGTAKLFYEQGDYLKPPVNWCLRRIASPLRTGRERPQ